MELRPYQVAAVEAVRRAWDSCDATLVLMPTGCGKTQVGVAVVRERPGRTLWLAHREELLTQAADRVESMAGFRPDVEKAEYHDARQSRILVASVQTMSRAGRLARHAPDAFATVVVDEVHHAAADTYLRILEHFSQAKRLGLTATATRADGKRLGEEWDDVAYEYALPDAIRDGWLAPIRRRAVRVTDLDLDGVETRGGDFVAGQLERRVLEGEATIHEWAKGILHEAGERKTLAFCPGVESSRRLAEIICRYRGAGAAVHLDGETPADERRLALARFARGEHQYVTNCALFLEGFDEPTISCVAMCRPTKSHVLYVQAVGRGTRLAEGKRDLLVIDFTDASQRYGLVTAVDILGAADDEDVRRDAERIAEREGVDVLDALARAREAKQSRMAEARARLEEQLAAERRNGVRATAHVHGFDLDDILGVNRYATAHQARRFGAKPLSEKQLALLRKHGLDQGLDLDTEAGRAQARARLDKWFERVKAGLCSWKQARVLRRSGLPDDVCMSTAGVVLDALAARKWRPLSHDERRRWIARMREHDAAEREQGGREDGA